MQINPKTRGFIAGKTQTGKTFLCKRMLQSVKNYIIYDTKTQYAGFGAICRTIEQLKSAVLSGCYRIVYQPLNYTPDHFDEVCLFIRNNLKNILFFVEEMQTYVTKAFMPPNFLYIISAMEEKGVGVWGTSQRPQLVHNDFLSQLSWCQCFRIYLYDDAVAMAKLLRVSPEQLMNLENFWSVNFSINAPKGKEISICPPIS